MRPIPKGLIKICGGCTGGDEPEPNEQSVLLNTSGNPTKVYAYSPNTKSLTLLDIPDITRSSSDIAHTGSKLWLYSQLPVSPYTRRFGEWDITFEPFSASFNRYITITKYGSGLCLKDDNTLITSLWTIVISVWVSKIYECDIATGVETYKFDLFGERVVTGDYILTTTNKFIILTGAPDETKYISQYDYNTGNIEIDMSLSPSLNLPYGLFVHNNEIYIADLRGSLLTYIWKIDKTTPYALTLFDTLDIGINGASQLSELINVHFT